MTTDVLLLNNDEVQNILVAAIHLKRDLLRDNLVNLALTFSNV